MASGYSRRMGKNKLCESLCGKPVVQWVIDSAIKTGVKDICLVYREPCVSDIAESSGINTLYNPWSFLGQSACLRVAAESLLPAKTILFIPGDQPLITPESLMRIMDRFRKNAPDIVCASWCGNRAMPALFSGALTRQLMTLEGDMGGRPLITSGLYRLEYQELSFEEEQWDIDTEEDMKKIRLWCEANGRREG